MPVPPVIQMYRYVMGSGGGVSNLLLGSEELGSTGVGRWNQLLMNAVNANVSGVANPLNSDETVDQLDFQADKRARITQDVTLVAGTEYTFSVWARAASGTQDFRLSYWDYVGRNFGTSAHTASATWSPSTGRYSFTFTAATSGTFSMYIQNSSADPVISRRIYFWGAMLNVGATAADYVKTTFIGPSSPATPPMEFGDNFAGVTAYYSLRRFTRGDDNNAIRVRRSSDDTEQDIGFDANGDLDTTALLAFVGTGGTDNGFVTTWYDQTGNGNDATNATSTEQPLVVSGGSVVTLDGYACLDGDLGAGDTMLQASNVIDSVGDVAIFSTYALKTDGTVANQITFEIGNGTSTHRIHDTLGRGGAGTFGIDIRGTTNYDFGNATGVAVDDIYLNSILSETNGFYINGTQQTSDNAVRSGSTVDALTLFNRGGGAFPYKGKFFEFIFFDSDQSSNRGTVTAGGGTGIEGNINTYFDIV